MANRVVASMKPPAKGFTAWSYSRYRDYEKCPRAAKFNHIDKLTPPESPQMTRGSGIHTFAAEYIMGERGKLPADLEMFTDLFFDLRMGYPDTVLVEDSWAFRDDWSVTTWDDWADCRVRIKVDAARLDEDGELDIFDWKTGKFSPQWNLTEYEQQLELYSLGALIMFGETVPNLKVSPRLIYLDHGIVYPEEPKVYTMDNMTDLKRTWKHRSAAMLNDKMFSPNPGRQCSWCAYSNAKPKPLGDTVNTETTIRFGKCIGLTLPQIRDRDPRYFRWLINQDWIMEVFDPDDVRDHGGVGYTFDGVTMPFGQWRGWTIERIVFEDRKYAETIARQPWGTGPIGQAFRVELARRNSVGWTADQPG